MQDAYSGSDENLGCGELAQARRVHFDGPIPLESGPSLPELDVVYETYGQLSPARDNAVLICHALTGDSHVAAHAPDDEPGWWDIMVGPGKPIDTDRLFVICPNCLGGCRGTTGPNAINPETDQPYGPDFPAITTGDIVDAQARLVEYLGIEKLLAVVGGSMGGHQALLWGTRYPARVGGVVALATSPRLSSQSLAFDVIGRNAITRDPHYHGGRYYDKPDGPDVGLALARMLGHITYLSPQAMAEKFEATRTQPRDIDTDFEKEFSVGTYLAYKSESFIQRFDANSYLKLSMAMDQFDLGRDVDALAGRFAGTSCRWLIVSFTSDWLFPSQQSRQMVHALIREGKPVSYCDVHSQCGHDAFLLEDDQASYGELTRGFLANLQGQNTELRDPRSAHAPTSIWHHKRRLDYEQILELIPPRASVLDLGCGRGGLLDKLKRKGHERLMGLEIDPANVVECVRGGLDVAHHDIGRGLDWFADDQFDCVVLSRTIQAIYDVELVLREMLRVGRQCVVSVPNFFYHKLQDQLAATGRAPEAALLHYHWYDTPNIRILTLRDFEQYCHDQAIRIHRCIALDTEQERQLGDDEDANSQADMAIYVISR